MADTDQKTVNSNETAEKNKTENNGDKSENANEKSEKMIPKTRFDQVVEQRKEAEKALDDIAQELIEEIPEDLRDLIPELPTAKKISWLRNATKKGIFNTKNVGNSPDSKRPQTKPSVDLDKMTPTQMMALGYSQK